MNAFEAKKYVRDTAIALGLTYGKISAKTSYFDGSPAVCVTLRDCIPSPAYEQLKNEARRLKIVLVCYVDGISS